MSKRRPLRILGLLLAAAALAAAAPAFAKSRIKDIVEFEGVRDNMLVGYGIVVGLNGTGDQLRNAPFTKQSLEAMLERLGVNVRDADAQHQERRRGDGHRQAAGLRRRRARRSTPPSRPWATPRACWAAPCWSPR